MSMGFLELEKARIARLESERIANNIAAALPASPNVNAVKARDLLERRDAAYQAAMSSVRSEARAATFETKAKAQTAFDRVSQDPKSAIVELHVAYRALRIAHEQHETANEIGNGALEQRRQISAPQGIASLTFAQVVDHVDAWHVAAAGEASRQGINDAMNAAGVAAAAKVNGST